MHKYTGVIQRSRNFASVDSNAPYSEFQVQVCFPFVDQHSMGYHGNGYTTRTTWALNHNSSKHCYSQGHSSWPLYYLHIRRLTRDLSSDCNNSYPGVAWCKLSFCGWLLDFFLNIMKHSMLLIASYTVTKALKVHFVILTRCFYDIVL